MKKLIYKTISLVCFIPSLGFSAGADGNTYQAMSSSGCKLSNISIYDKYYLPAQMPAGKFKGECLNVEKMRNLVLLSNINSPKIQIANFFHNNKYWVVTFPELKNITRAILQVEYFPPEWLAAHTQIRFDLEEGSSIKLMAQDGSGDTLELRNFVFSFEAVRRIGFPKYDLIKGAMSHFGMAARAFSLQTAYEKIVEIQKHKNDQIILDYNQDQRVSLFKKLLISANANKNHTEMYDTIENNCTTKLYEAIESVSPMPTRLVKAGPKGNKINVRRTHLLSFLPSTAVTHIKIRELFQALAPSLETEFSSIGDIYQK